MASITKGYTFGAAERVTNVKLHTLVDSATISLVEAVPVGSTTPSSGAFTSLSSSGATTIGDAAGDGFTINPSAWTLANAVTITGTWADLGIVTTVDINGGTLDGVQIGGTEATGELIVNNASDQADGLGSQGTAGQVLTSAGAGANPTWANNVSSDYILLTHTVDSGTDGGTVTEGQWNTRTINTEDIDSGDNCTLSSSQITLSAGTYECIINVVSYSCGESAVRLYNTTDTSTILSGNSYADTGGSAITHTILGRFTIAASKALEVQQYCSSTQPNNGMGIASALGVSEVYLQAMFKKVA